ncbi:hypothetical protein KKB44_04165 [Candidatus Micrarchaeota archaeon]|nr:hypothetical protein [Candidatus Micrarchaeota archaeon]
MTHQNKTHQPGTGRREEKPRFTAPHSDSVCAILRQKHRAMGIMPAQSLMMLVEGNKEHVAILKSLNITPIERHQKIMNGEADYLLIACSDARVLRMDSEGDELVGMQIRVAGNVIPTSGPSFDEIKQAAGRVKKDGVIIIQAHSHCGAVKEKVKWDGVGRWDTGSDPLNALLTEISGDTPQENALGQLVKAKQEFEVHTGTMLYNWDETTEAVRILHNGVSAIIEILCSKWNLTHLRANEDGRLSEKLAVQKPHAIVVGSNDLPYSVATITRAEQNDVFCTTGSEGGLDDFDEASVLYAVEHLGVRHISFIAPGHITDDQKLNQLFDKWEQDLRSMTVGGEPKIANMIDSKELAISNLRYDLSTGCLTPLQLK